MLKRLRSPVALLSGALLLIACVGILGRGYWTPDEPREADIAWRMSWQPDKSVPLLAGEAFCEKPPLTYWLAAAPMRLLGEEAWAARLPNLLYALITSLSVGLLARRSMPRGAPADAAGIAGLAAAAAISTFLLSYQVAIWLATDAPLLAFDSAALLGAYLGFYATTPRSRLGGYSLMHAALGLGFLSKSAAAWMVPALALISLAIWEKRWRELFRWELSAGLVLQAAMILTWVWFVYMGADGPAHLKVFFWNNLVGRFTHIDAPVDLQYAAGHRNSPGKYLIELPLYLFPWTFLVAAAARCAWQQRRTAFDDYRPVRFALAVSLPPLAFLSVAATARNIYLAPALPGAALLLAWWVVKSPSYDRWDIRAVRATAALMLLGVAVFVAVLIMLGARAGLLVSSVGLTAAAFLALRAWTLARTQARGALWLLLLAYCALLAGPASGVYREVDTWQDLGQIARAMESDSAGKPLILFAPDETTRAVIDMYARTRVSMVPGPIDAAAIRSLKAAARAAPGSYVVALLPRRAHPDAKALARVLGLGHGHPAPPADQESELPWARDADLRVAKRYSLTNGRRYALLQTIS